MWLTIAIVGYLAQAIVNILDKFILSEKKVSPLRFVFYSTIFTLPILILVPWASWPQNSLIWLMAILSGLTFGLGLWTMYLGIIKGEISHVAPLVGGITPIFILFFSRSFLGEIITTQQTWAILLLVVGSLLISFQNTEVKRDWKLALIWGILAGIFFAISHTSAKYLYDQIGFFGGFVWSRGFIGLAGILLLLYPKFYRELMSGSRGYVQKETSPTIKEHLPIVILDKILGVAGVVLVQYAIALGSVTVVNALAGVQYAILLILIGVFSRFFPKLFKENYTVPEIVQEVLSIIIIGLGLGLLF